MKIRKDDTKDRKITITYNHEFVFHDINTDPELDSIIAQIIPKNKDKTDTKELSKSCEILLNIDHLIKKFKSYAEVINDRRGLVKSIKDRVVNKIKDFSYSYFNHTNPNKKLIDTLTGYKDIPKEFQTNDIDYYDLSQLGEFSTQIGSDGKIIVYIKEKPDKNKDKQLTDKMINDMIHEYCKVDKKDITPPPTVWTEQTFPNKKYYPDYKKDTLILPSKEESKEPNTIKEIVDKNTADLVNKTESTQEKKEQENANPEPKSEIQITDLKIPKKKRGIKHFLANLAASLVFIDPTISSKSTQTSQKSITLNINPGESEKERIYSTGWETINEETIGAVNYLDSTEIPYHEKKKFIELLKRNDPRARKIARNYSTFHPMSLMKDNAFLKVYSSDKTLVNSPTDYKKDLEVIVTKILLDKGINVPKIYCDASILGLNSTLQERIQGTELSDFIINNPNQKDQIINIVIEQLAKIHYYLTQEKIFHSASLPLYLEKMPDPASLFVHGFLRKIGDASALVLQGNGLSLLAEEGEKYEIKVRCEDEKRLTESFKPISKELWKLKRGIYIDSNPANILINHKGEVYNVDFENIKTQPFQFDLAILSAGLGLSDEEQTQIIDKYLQYKSELENKEYNEEEKRDFHRGYNLVSILRNLTLAGNMQDYILKYNEKRALEDQLRYLKQAKQAIDRALNSDVMSKEDKKMIKSFKQTFEQYEVIHTKIEPSSYSAEAPSS